MAITAAAPRASAPSPRRARVFRVMVSPQVNGPVATKNLRVEERPPESGGTRVPAPPGALPPVDDIPLEETGTDPETVQREREDVDHGQSCPPHALEPPRGAPDHPIDLDHPAGPAHGPAELYLLAVRNGREPSRDGKDFSPDEDPEVTEEQPGPGSDGVGNPAAGPREEAGILASLGERPPADTGYAAGVRDRPERIGGDAAIGMEEEQHLSLRCGSPRVHLAAPSPRGLEEGHRRGECPGVFPDEGNGGVGASAVDDDQLERPPQPGEVIEKPPDPGLLVEHRGDDRDQARSTPSRFQMVILSRVEIASVTFEPGPWRAARTSILLLGAAWLLGHGWAHAVAPALIIIAVGIASYRPSVPTGVISLVAPGNTLPAESRVLAEGPPRGPVRFGTARLVPVSFTGRSRDAAPRPARRPEGRDSPSSVLSAPVPVPVLRAVAGRAVKGMQRAGGPPGSIGARGG